jgi:hypothetical protein
MYTRKNLRSSRRNKRSMRKSKQMRKHRGGMSSVNQDSMVMSTKDSLSQGSQFLNMHKAQHGGGPAPYSAVTNSVLPSSMVASARTGPLDVAIAGAQKMQDGGKRCSMYGGSRKNRRSKQSRKNRRSKHSRMHSRRRMHGGGHVTGAPLNADSMLLPSGLERQAALNYEWSMAKNPSSFAPK